MKENTVYLLYNTNAGNVKLHHRLVENFKKETGNRDWEYEDNDEFTIMYSPEDERKYTDIKIMSKTKLKERPKSADQLIKKPKVSIEGIFMRRSNSLSMIEEDLVELRRCPLIKPLLSESEIQQLQLILEECRKNKQLMDKAEANMTNGLHKPSSDYQKFTKIADLQDTRTFESTKDMYIKTAPITSPQELDANKTQEKANILTKSTKNDITGKTKILDNQKKPASSNTEKLKKDENDNKLTGVSQEMKPKKRDFVQTRSKSEDGSKNDKRKSKQSTKVVKEGGTKKHRDETSETQQKLEKITSKKKTSHEDEPKEKKQRKPEKDAVKAKEGSGKITRNKENVSDQDQFSHSSEKTPTSKEKTQKKSNENIKSNDNKTKLKNITDKKRTPSISTNEKIDKYVQRKSVISSRKLSKNEKEPKSSISLASKQNVKKGKTDQVKSISPNKKDFVEEFRPKKDEKLFPTKSFPSDKIKTKIKIEDLETEDDSAKKVKTKDKLLPGMIQYMVHYILSNPIFINLGWTLRPSKKALSRIVTFKAIPANPKSYCFRCRDNIDQTFYPSGVLALNIANNGIGRINYPSGAPAVIITKSDTGMKLTLYSCPTNDPLIKKSFYTRIIGMFDCFGYGIVYNANGKQILKFNQMEGIYYNPSKKTQYKWQWSCSKVLEAQRMKELLKVMVNEVKQPVPTTKVGKIIRAPSSSGSKKSATSLENKPADKLYEALLEELPYPVMPKSKIKMKAHNNAFKSIILKVNKEITLRINGQDSVSVNFSAKTLFYKLELGVRIDPDSVERIDEIADDRIENVPSLLGDLLHRSPSLQKLHQLLDPNTLL